MKTAILSVFLASASALGESTWDSQKINSCYFELKFRIFSVNPLSCDFFHCTINAGPLQYHHSLKYVNKASGLLKCH